MISDTFYCLVHLFTTSFKKPQGKLLYVRLLKKANIARKFLPLRSKLLSVANPSLLLFGLALYYLALCCKTHKILNLMSNTFKTIEYKAYQGKRRSISIFRTFQKLKKTIILDLLFWIFLIREECVFKSLKNECEIKRLK